MKWVGIVLKEREAIEEDVEDIESKWDCIAVIAQLVLIATRRGELAS
jgi:hypothetical protein